MDDLSAVWTPPCASHLADVVDGLLHALPAQASSDILRFHARDRLSGSPHDERCARS